MGKKPYWSTLSALSLLFLFVLLATACGQGSGNTTAEKAEHQEKEISLDQVPAAVKETILKEAGGNKITEVEVVKEGDKEIYEAKWRADGDEIEVRVAADGTLLGKEKEEAEESEDEAEEEHGDDQEENEREVTLDEVPAAVKATILSEAGEHEIKDIDEITKDNEVIYEAEWIVDGQEIVIKVAADGTLISKGVEPADDDDDEEEGDES